MLSKKQLVPKAFGIILLFVITFSYNSFTQNNIIFHRDSLLNLLVSAPDSSKASIYNDLAFIYSDSSGNIALNFATKALILSRKFKQTNREAYAHIMLGSTYFSKSDYNKAIEEFEKAIPIAKKNDNFYQLHTIYNNLGIIYKYAEEYELALQSYSKALYNADLCNDLNTVIQTYNNIGNVYILQNELESGLHYFNKSLEYCYKESEFIGYLPMLYNNIAYIHFENKKFDLAKESYQKAYNLFDSIDNKYGMAVTLNNLAEICIEQNDLIEGEKLIYQADSLHNLMNFTNSRSNLYLTAYQLFKNIGDYNRALTFYETYVILRDSVYNNDFQSKIKDIETKYEVEKVKLQSEAKDYKITQQQKINLALLLVIVIILLLVIFLISLVKQKHKLNTLLSLSNSVLKDKEIEINENLQYARKIQKNCMLNNNLISLHDYFVLDLPKTKVGGDFYLIRKKEKTTFYAVADSTGHGISGGFLSVLGIEFLKQSIDKYDNVEEILNHLNNRFYNSITKSDNLSNESLCISLISLYENKLYFAGSKHKLWVINNENEIKEFKSDSQIIGIQENYYFENTRIELQKDSIIILSSDGFPDQFGANNGGKLKYNRFRSMLKQCYTKDTKEIYTFLHHELNLWRKDEEQTDDILVLGIKF